MRQKEIIPVHQIQTHLPDSFFVKYYEDLDHDAKKWAHNRHRDEYYIFLFLSDGLLKMEIDFKEVTIEGPMIYFVRPGQVHNIVYFDGKSGWTMGVDPSFLHASYRQQLEKTCIDPSSLKKQFLVKEFQLLRKMMQRLNQPSNTLSNALKKDLVNSIVGLILSCVQDEKEGVQAFPERWQKLYNDFRDHANQNFRSIKQPSAYADMMHLSLSYLNEIVKSISGFTVSYWIIFEVVLEAKRLLYYTSLTVKEIAYELGYEDAAYFSRLFTNSAAVSPTVFRKQNHE